LEKKDLRATYSKWDVEEVVAHLRNLLARRRGGKDLEGIKEQWISFMTSEFVPVVVTWVKMHKVALLPTNPDQLLKVLGQSAWIYGPERKSTDFNGYF